MQGDTDEKVIMLSFYTAEDVVPMTTPSGSEVIPEF